MAVMPNLQRKADAVRTTALTKGRWVLRAREAVGGVACCYGQALGGVRALVTADAIHQIISGR